MSIVILSIQHGPSVFYVMNGVLTYIGEWRSLVARFVRDEEAAGSNPVSPTKY